MAVGDSKRSADSPRESGIILICFGFLGLVLSVNLLCQSGIFGLSEETLAIIANVCTILAMAGPLLMIVAGIYGLRHRRIFGIKISPKTRAKVRKYYKLADISSILAGILVPLAIYSFSIAEIGQTVSHILGTLAAVAVIVFGIITSIVELSAECRR